MEVEIVHWPVGEPRRRELRSQRAPRLLLLGGDQAPPLSVDPLEDWIRLPADDRDVESRVEALSQRGSTDPALDDDGILRHGAGLVALPPIEVRLVATLLDRLGKVVSREELTTAGWPGEHPKRNVLDVHVLRLRRRLDPLGLTIRTVRQRGYLLDGGPSPASTDRRKTPVADT